MDRRTLVPLAVLGLAVLGVLVWRAVAGPDARPGSGAGPASSPGAAAVAGSAAEPGASPDGDPGPTPGGATDTDPDGDERGPTSDPATGSEPATGSDETSPPDPQAAAGATSADRAAAEPGPSADERPTHGTLSPGAIRDVVRQNAGYFRFCFEWELHRHPDLAGRVTMEFVIAEDGSVREAHVMEDGLENETVNRCFAGVTSRMTFPPPEHGEVTVHYPFLLDGAPPAERPEGI